VIARRFRDVRFGFSESEQRARAGARIEGMDLDAEAVGPHSTAGLRRVVVSATAVMLIAAARWRRSSCEA